MGAPPLIRRLVGAAALGPLVVVGAAAELRAQGYRVELDTRAQGVTYRGVTLDSIPATQTVPGPDGGPTTPDGFAVRCQSGAPYCFYFRPGPERRGGPLTTVARVSLWGLGVPGLRARTTARLGVDLGDANVWPGTEPAVQLLEGYVEYAVERLTAQLGRQTVGTRFGMTGFDGAQVTVRDGARGLEAMGYAGWGLARGAALPVTSPALNPLDDFQPSRRQLVAGFGAGWLSSWAEARVVYQREVDPRSDQFVSERVGVDAGVRPLAGWSLMGGAAYDIAAGWWGNAEATLGYTAPTGWVAGAIGLRRYRPHLDLWTIWGAFSPVPYHATRGSLTIAPRAWLRLHARGERYWFDEAEATTPLVENETDGWRFASGATVTPSPVWTIEGGYRAEFGPGASSRGFDGAVRYQPAGPFAVGIHAATLDRPLEFRFDEAAVRLFGADAEYRPSAHLRVQLGASRYAEDRQRPDAAAFDWNQVRVSARVVLQFSSGEALGALPPAVGRGDREAP